MFLTLELVFILLLVIVLFMIYGTDRLSKKSRQPRAIVEEYWDGRERRQYVRFKKTLEVEYIILRKPHLDNDGKTLDISEGGVKLMTGEKLGAGTILEIRIALPNSRHVAEVEGEVVWSEEAVGKGDGGERLFHSGIKFSSIREPGGAALLDYIRLLGSDL